MKNITVSVNDETYRRARRKAAEHNTSVSQLVAEYLRTLTKDEELRAERNKKLDELFAAQDRRRKRKPIGRLKREEIYTRGLR
jgi:predicted CopG family antitoxin